MAFGGNPVFANNKSFSDKPPVAMTPQGYAQQGTQPPLYSQEQLEQMYQQPSASNGQMRRMTYDDVLMKTLACLGLVLLGGLVGWMFPVVTLPAAIAGLVLGLVNAFRKEPSKPLILAYAAVQGLFVGGLTMILESRFPGIAVQAVLGTAVVFGLTLALFKFGNFRATPKMVKFFTIALGAYLIFSLLNFGLVMFGAIESPWGMRGIEIAGIPLGVIIGIVAIGLAAFSLIMDFTSIEQGVQNGLPEKYSWSAAFGLTVTVVWLYVEILRLLAILRGDN
ncbi:Bax inhibitor-1/YccA family protein [Acaricomes phytoseiuli]|uniref:Bax inhibitor-1/YccA family protein n=1 Tax=Acaricomes phytoseiuli TaxID=291968 RepID=UPI000378ABB9|nr:Bax inhibitor-1/YccA family protein [Acaricomes phytoseiuli]MCW1249996.1 Bax inhibitor-1/YccA family protein [Acaricomes phytoseiuli]